MLAVVEFGIVMSPAFLPLGGVTDTREFTMPQPPKVLSVAVKVDVWAVPVISVCTKDAIELRLNVIAQGD